MHCFRIAEDVDIARPVRLSWSWFDVNIHREVWLPLQKQSSTQETTQNLIDPDRFGPMVDFDIMNTVNSPISPPILSHWYSQLIQKMSNFSFSRPLFPSSHFYHCPWHTGEKWPN